MAKMIALTSWATQTTANIEKNDDPETGGDDYEFGGVDVYEINEWPMTLGDDWCGEFESQ